MVKLQIVGDKPLEKDKSLEARFLRIKNSENRIKLLIAEIEDVLNSSDSAK